MTQTDNGNRYALHALKERRASIAGDIKQCEERLRYLRQALAHLDGALVLFDPDGNPSDIKPKRPYRRVKLFGAGKLNRLILDALRRAERPMTTAEVIDAVVAELGYGPEAAAGMKGRVRSNLLYLSKVRGSVTKDGERETATWRLVESTP